MQVDPLDYLFGVQTVQQQQQQQQQQKRTQASGERLCRTDSTHRFADIHGDSGDTNNNTNNECAFGDIIHRGYNNDDDTLPTPPSSLDFPVHLSEAVGLAEEADAELLEAMSRTSSSSSSASAEADNSQLYNMLDDRDFTEEKENSIPGCDTDEAVEHEPEPLLRLPARDINLPYVSRKPPVNSAQVENAPPSTPALASNNTADNEMEKELSPFRINLAGWYNDRTRLVSATSSVQHHQQRALRFDGSRDSLATGTQESPSRERPTTHSKSLSSLSFSGPVLPPQHSPAPWGCGAAAKASFLVSADGASVPVTAPFQRLGDKSFPGALADATAERGYCVGESDCNDALAGNETRAWEEDSSAPADFTTAAAGVEEQATEGGGAVLCRDSSAASKAEVQRLRRQLEELQREVSQSRNGMCLALEKAATLQVAFHKLAATATAAIMMGGQEEEKESREENFIDGGNNSPNKVIECPSNSCVGLTEADVLAALQHEPGCAACETDGLHSATQVLRLQYATTLSSLRERWRMVKQRQRALTRDTLAQAVAEVSAAADGAALRQQRAVSQLEGRLVTLAARVRPALVAALAETAAAREAQGKARAAAREAEAARGAALLAGAEAQHLRREVAALRERCGVGEALERATHATCEARHAATAALQSCSEGFGRLLSAAAGDATLTPSLLEVIRQAALRTEALVEHYTRELYHRLQRCPTHHLLTAGGSGDRSRDSNGGRGRPTGGPAAPTTATTTASTTRPVPSPPLSPRVRFQLPPDDGRRASPGPEAARLSVDLNSSFGSARRGRSSSGGSLGGGGGGRTNPSGGLGGLAATSPTVPDAGSMTPHQAGVYQEMLRLIHTPPAALPGPLSIRSNSSPARTPTPPRLAALPHAPHSTSNSQHRTPGGAAGDAPAPEVEEALRGLTGGGGDYHCTVFSSAEVLVLESLGRQLRNLCTLLENHQSAAEDRHAEMRAAMRSWRESLEQQYGKLFDSVQTALAGLRVPPSLTTGGVAPTAGATSGTTTTAVTAADLPSAPSSGNHTGSSSFSPLPPSSYIMPTTEATGPKAAYPEANLATSSRVAGCGAGGGNIRVLRSSASTSAPALPALPSMIPVTPVSQRTADTSLEYSRTGAPDTTVLPPSSANALPERVWTAAAAAAAAARAPNPPISWPTATAATSTTTSMATSVQRRASDSVDQRNTVTPTPASRAPESSRLLDALSGRSSPAPTQVEWGCAKTADAIDVTSVYGAFPSADDAYVCAGATTGRAPAQATEAAEEGETRRECVPWRTSVGMPGDSSSRPGVSLSQEAPASASVSASAAPQCYFLSSPDALSLRPDDTDPQRCSISPPAAPPSVSLAGALQQQQQQQQQSRGMRADRTVTAQPPYSSLDEMNERMEYLFEGVARRSSSGNSCGAQGSVSAGRSASASSVPFSTLANTQPRGRAGATTTAEAGTHGVAQTDPHATATGSEVMTMSHSPASQDQQKPQQPLPPYCVPSGADDLNASRTCRALSLSVKEVTPAAATESSTVSIPATHWRHDTTTPTPGAPKESSDDTATSGMPKQRTGAVVFGTRALTA